MFWGEQWYFSLEIHFISIFLLSVFKQSLLFLYYYSIAQNNYFSFCIVLLQLFLYQFYFVSTVILVLVLVCVYFSG